MSENGTSPLDRPPRSPRSETNKAAAVTNPQKGRKQKHRLDKMAAIINEEARKKANLRVLQRLDPSILDIVGSATHVVLYEFSDTEQQWEKRNVEGSLFLAKRSDAPRFKLVVLNRSSTENLEVPLSATFQMQVREPYLIFREEKHGVNPIRGIWFHDGGERTAIASLLDRVVKSLAHVADLEKQHAPASEENEQQQRQPQQTNQQQTADEGAAAAALLSPLTLGGGQASAAAVASGGGGGSSSAARQNSPHLEQNLVLDKKSLQLSLMSLIQDERFLDLIHAQYLKVAHARAKNKDAAKK